MAKKTFDLGFKPRHMLVSAEPSEKAEKKEPPTVYPSFTIEENAELIKAMMAKGEFTATVKLRVDKANLDKGGGNYGSGEEHHSITLEVCSLTPEIEMKEESKETPAKDSLDSFFGKRKRPDDTADY